MPFGAANQAIHSLASPSPIKRAPPLRRRPDAQLPSRPKLPSPENRILAAKTMPVNRYSLPAHLSTHSQTNPGAMFDIVCNLPLSSDLFTLATHPSSPLVAVGLAAGHVQTLRLPPVEGDQEEDDDDDDEDDFDVSHVSGGSNGVGQIETSWRTRRHKGSCRALGWSADGRALYSAGTDGLLKGADAETGQVSTKVLVPDDA